MLLKNCIYGLIFLISLSSLFLLIFSIKNRNKYVLKIIRIIDIVYILYLMFIVFVSQQVNIAYQLDILIYEGLGVNAILLLIISIIVCSVKKGKVHIDIKSKKLTYIMVILLVIPIISFMSMYFREKYLINNSDLILVYHSSGNGGFGDGASFAYAINNDYCKEISIGTYYDGYNMEDFLPKSFFEVNPQYIKTINTEYEIKYDVENRKILIYKGGKCIHEKKLNSKYFNIDLKKVFVITNKE